VWSSKHPLSLSIVHTSPPKHASKSMYTYLESRKVRYNLQEVKGWTGHMPMFHGLWVLRITLHYYNTALINLSYLQEHLLSSSVSSVSVNEILCKPNFIHHMLWNWILPSSDGRNSIYHNLAFLCLV
jgi:hypothetical protein